MTAISIIMPAFNAARYISTTIESVKAQSFDDWELLINDDGSSNCIIAIIEKHTKVDFLGVLTAEESLRHAASCDAVFAYYALISKNNLNASPNKIHDAMSIGRPIILNSEVKISSFVIEHETEWTCPYHDVDELKRIIDALRAQRSTLPSFALHARSIFKRGNDWSEMERRLAVLYNSLG